MNVGLDHTAVRKYATIPRGHITASVTLDTDSTATTILAVVSPMSEDITLQYRSTAMKDFWTIPTQTVLRFLLVMNMICHFVCILAIDIDECAERIANCSHLCTNTMGSYSCYCNNGYRLAADNHQCDGNIAILLVVKIS